MTSALALGLMVGSPAGVGADDAVPPSQWPSTSTLSARLEGWPNAVRYSGNDRYQTNLAVTLGLRGRGDFPFDTPDRSSGGAVALSTANDWWGAGTCPRAVIVVTGDNPADSLGASALSDPTHQSLEPLLQRTAAADPSFDRVGIFARVDTDSAPILITASARSGAVSLSPATRIAANDMRRGGCTLARQAIVVGGPSAVPIGVDAELLSLGYREVFRVSGADRYETAALIARSLGTVGAPNSSLTCVDPDTTDGSAHQTFYTNAVVELRESASSCRLLRRTVVLADGVTGADALAAGWWTSFWQVPVLLHDGGDSLPRSTIESLLTMDVTSIIVLGGTSRISAEVAAEAQDLAGATELVRLAGADRYETSVQMAQQLGGWWPTGDAADFDSSMVCLAASGGNGASATGWPDALGAGPFCGAIGGAASNPGVPTRALPLPTGDLPTSAPVVSPRPAHDAVPILLVPSGSRTLAPAVAALLSAAFSPDDQWCTSTPPQGSCSWPGFAVGFGGEEVLSGLAIDQASHLLGGGRGPLGTMPPAAEAPPFFTNLNMSPIFDTQGSDPSRVCALRRSYTDARWLALYSDDSGERLSAALDIMFRNRYLNDADSVARLPSLGSPVCVGNTGSGLRTSARFVGISGRLTELTVYPLSSEHRAVLTEAITVSSSLSSSGSPLEDTSPDGSQTSLVFESAGGTGVTFRGEALSISATSLTVVLQRPDTGAAAVRFSATWLLATSEGVVNGSAVGEAIYAGDAWQLRGRSTFADGSADGVGGYGGFSCQLTPNTPQLFADDSVSWRVDGVLVD